jgi:hypothetical protein
MLRATALAMIVLLATSAFAARFDRQSQYDRVYYRLHQDERRQLAVDALTSMFDVAQRNLRESDRAADADRLLNEWNGHYKAVVGGVMPEDVGDHAPLSEWLAYWYALLEAEYGLEFMELSHLRDIWIMNFTLPVVFNPRAQEQWCVEQLRDHPGDKCADEYARHFVGTKYGPYDPYNTAELHHGFSGVVAYWVTYTACSMALAGTGAFLICGPAASLTELSIEIFVAPEVSTMIWNRYNP